jgi:hypothetical protein
MKKTLSIFIFLAFIALVIGCDNAPPPPVPSSSPSVNASSESPATSQQKSSKGWPYNIEKEIPKEFEQGKDVAKDLLADNYLLVFDGSGSMNDSMSQSDENCRGDGRKIDIAKKAAVEWGKTIPAGANVGLVSFNSSDWTRSPILSDKTNFFSKINSIENGGSTPLASAMAEAYYMLSVQGLKQLGYGKYVIVVITDGMANSESELQQWVDSILATSPIQIYTIGFCIQGGHSLNRPGLTTYRSANNPEDLKRGLAETLAELETFE